MSPQWQSLSKSASADATALVLCKPHFTDHQRGCPIEWSWDRRHSEADSESRLGIELSPYEMSATVTELVWSQRTPTGSFMQTTPTHLRLPNLSILVGKFEIDYSGQCPDICIQQKTDFSLWSCRLVNGWSLHWEGLNWDGWTERPWLTSLLTLTTYYWCQSNAYAKSAIEIC